MLDVKLLVVVGMAVSTECRSRLPHCSGDNPKVLISMDVSFADAI